MLPQKSNSLMYKKHSITTTLGVVVMLLLFVSCGRGKTDVGDAITERDSLPTMSTLGVTTFISDSGRTRFKMIAEEWLIFDKKNPSYWAFEKGAYLEKFDSIFNVEATIKADTVYHYDKKNLWELRSNVHIENINGEKFDTDLLFWDRNTGKVYSDRYIRIEQKDRTIAGIGFESNQDMTKYQIRKVTGDFYIDDFESAPPAGQEASGDSIRPLPADSITTLQADSIN